MENIIINNTDLNFFIIMRSNPYTHQNGAGTTQEAVMLIGKKQSARKLTDEQVEQILDGAEMGRDRRELAKEFGVSYSLVTQIVLRYAPYDGLKSNSERMLEKYIRDLEMEEKLLKIQKEREEKGPEQAVTRPKLPY